MIHLEDATKVHEIVDREVLVQDPHRTSREAVQPLLLKTLVSESEEVAVLALGDTGSRLRGFAQAVEGSKHPDLVEVKDDLLADYHEFSIVANEMVKLTSLASDAKLTNVLPYINKIIPKVAGYVPAAKDLDDPQKTLNFVRFVGDRVKRESIRSRKKVQTVNLQMLIQKNPDQWGKSGNSFISLARNQVPFESDIETCSRRAKGMSEIGAPGLASRMAERALEFRLHSKEMYYGFNRMTVTAASIIAGKIMNCDLSPTSIRSYRITIPNDTVKMVFGMLGEASPISKGNAVLFEPRLYPLHAVAETMSARTSNLIDLFETFPEAGGCPIFDHYWCLVPSFFVLNIPVGYGDWSKDISDLTTCFDKALLKVNAVPAILLGERDGKSYFLDYWC